MITRRGVLKTVLAGWAMLLLLTACASRPDVYQARHREPAGEIWGSHTVGQTFTSNASGLYRIDVFLATYARQNTGEVIFHLRRSPEDPEDLVTILFDAASVADNAYRPFTFLPAGFQRADLLLLLRVPKSPARQRHHRLVRDSSPWCWPASGPRCPTAT